MCWTTRASVTSDGWDRVRGLSGHASLADTACWMKDARRKTIPAQRFGTPEEFGAICAFLCSMHAGYMTGQNVLADGGAYPGSF